MTLIKILLLVSITLQMTGAVLALRLIKTTRHYTAWVALATAVGLMAIRRIVSLYGLWVEDVSPPVNMAPEVIALLISLLMVVAMIRIRPVMETLYQGLSDLESANRWLKREVVQRKIAEQQAGVNEEKFRKLADHSPILIWMADQKGMYTYFNERWLQFRGRTNEQERGMGWTGGLHPEDKTAVVEKYLHAFAKRESFEIEYRLLHVSGHYRWIYDKGSPMYNKNEDFLGYIGSCIDITERKEAERQLEKSENQKSLILKAMKEKLAFLDTDLRIQWTNEATQEIAGREKQELHGLFCHELWHNKGMPCKDCPAHKAMESGQSETSEVWFSNQLYSLRVYPVKESGILKGVLEVGDNITERKKTEQQLKQSEQKFRTFFNENNAVMLIIDPENGEIKSANRSAQKYYGYDELESMKIQQINILPEKQVVQKMHDVFNHQKKFFRFRHRLASGEVRHVEAYSTPIEIDGAKYLYSIVHDITDRIRAAEALRLSELKFRKIVNTLPQFVSYVDKDLIYRLINNTYLEKFGLKEKQIVGHHIREIIGQESFEKASPHIEKVMNGEEVHYREHYNYPNGIEADMEATLIPEFDRKGKVIGYYAILSDVSHHIQNQQLLEESRNRMRILSEYQQNLLEKERSYIAREIHDELGQNLTAIHMGVAMVKKNLPREQRPLLRKMEEVDRITDSTISALKKLSTELRPQLIDDMGLIAAIEWYVNHFEKRSGIACSLNLTQEDIIFPKDMAIHIYRILQEALTNVYKHAQAGRVEILLDRSGSQIHLIIRDDGTGFNKKDQDKGHSYGIMGMEERVRLMGGEFHISGGPQGTAIEIEIPFNG